MVEHGLHLVLRIVERRLEQAPADQILLADLLAAEFEHALPVYSLEHGVLRADALKVFIHRLVGLEGAVADLAQLRLGVGQVVQFVGGLGGHQQHVGIAHHDRLDAAVVARDDLVHPFVAVFAAVPFLDVLQLLPAAVPAEGHAGDVAAAVVPVVLVVERGKRADRAAGIRLAAVLIRRVVLDGVVVHPLAAVVGKGDHEERLASGRDLALHHATPDLLERAFQTHAGILLGDDLLAGVERLRVEGAVAPRLPAFGEPAATVLPDIARTDLPLVGTLRIPGGREAHAGQQSVGERLVDTGGESRFAGLVGPVNVIHGLLQIGDDLPVDDIAVALGLDDVARLADGLETRRNVAPGLDEVVVIERAQHQRLAQQVTHPGIVLHVAVLAQAGDGQIRVLDGGVGQGELAAALVELAVRIVVRRVIGVDQRLGVGGFVGRRAYVPLRVAVGPVVDQPAVAVGFVDAELAVNVHNGRLGIGLVRKHGLRIGRRGRTGVQQVFAARGGQQAGAGKDID